MAVATINYTLRIDETEKKQAEQVFGRLGLTLAAGFNVYLKAVVRQQRIPFELALNETTALAATPAKASLETKERSFQALNGLLAGHEVDLDKEREERISL
jgi:DNA-damage-inducible protein J